MKSGTRSKFFLTVIVVIGFMMASVPAIAGNFYLGGGIQVNTFRGDLTPGKYWDHDSAYGWDLNFGYRLTPKTALDVVYGSSEHDEVISATKSTFTWIEVGPKFFYNTDSNIQPYLTIGGGSYTLELKGVDYDGLGGFVGAGIEERGGRNHVVGIYVRANSWSDDSPNLHGVTISGGLNYNYYFGY